MFAVSEGAVARIDDARVCELPECFASAVAVASNVCTDPDPRSTRSDYENMPGGKRMVRFPIRVRTSNLATTATCLRVDSGFLRAQTMCGGGASR
eukprot:1947317-Rhodomonas_salina.1